MQTELQNTVFGRVKRQYIAPEPNSPVRCAQCKLNAFDVAFISAQVKPIHTTCCGLEAMCRQQTTPEVQ